MRQKAGFALQALVLMLMPVLIGWELIVPSHFLFLPTGLLISVCLFTLGYFLRQP